MLVSIQWNLLKSLFLPFLFFLITNYYTIVVTDDGVHRIKLSIYIV